MELYTNSMLKDWNTCKSRYYYKYVKKISIPKREENFELGKKVHALISYYLNGFDIRKMEKSASEEVLRHYNSILKHPLLRQEYFLSEWGFNVCVGDTDSVFTGRIDAIFYDKKNNTYTIADWKTGMNIPKVAALDEQARIYLYAFYRAQKDLKIEFMPENLRFVFVQTPTLNESSVTFSKELYEEIEQDLLRKTKEMQNCKNKPEYKELTACKFCEYRFICNKKQ